MNRVKIKAYAKINLTLEIVGERDGFHLLNSVVASVDLFDLITLKKRKDKLSFVTMKGQGSESIPPEENNALKAAERFSELFGTNGAEITVYKNIPIGAGLGGSSADVAGVLNGMAKLYNVTDQTALERLAETLGSDTKYMLSGGFQKMSGKGEELAPVSTAATLHFLAICPNSPVSAGGCYQQFDKLQIPLSNGEKTQELINLLQSNKPINEGGRYLTNDLYAPASLLNPDVEKAYQEALSFSPLGAIMSGSGSCVLAWFETRELCEWAKSRYRGKFKTFLLKTVIPSEEKRKIFKNPFALSKEETDEICENNEN